MRRKRSGQYFLAHIIEVFFNQKCIGTERVTCGSLSRKKTTGWFPHAPDPGTPARAPCPSALVPAEGGDGYHRHKKTAFLFVPF